MKNTILNRVPALILIDLLRKSKSGIEISKVVQSAFCHVYNILKDFETEGLIGHITEGRKIIYELTDRGRKIALCAQTIYSEVPVSKYTYKGGQK